MQKKALSTFGLIMNNLNIHTVSLSRAIHVDASLISKWKTGQRPLTEKSAYFEEIVDYIMEQSAGQGHSSLRATLQNLYPHSNLTEEIQIQNMLRTALQSTANYESFSPHRILYSRTKTVPIAVYDDNTGKREAISKLLDYAESIAAPGTLIFINSEEYDWFLEDPIFPVLFQKKILRLLEKGFRAKFVIYYSNFKEHFLHFFNATSYLIFHRNVEWFFYEYYDEAILNVSFFIVNQAISMLSLSGESTAPATMVFSNSSIVLQHELLANHVLSKCTPLFFNFATTDISDIVNVVCTSGKNREFYTYLPAPAFISVDHSLLKEVLEDNNIDAESIQKCLELNKRLWGATTGYFSKTYHSHPPFTHIFQLEELEARVREKTFTSTSLTLLGGKLVNIRASQYARILINLANGLIKHSNLQIILISKKDQASLPAINCWCQKNNWLIQMDKEGFRSSGEISIVNTAAAALERCIRRVPPERRERDSVRQILMELASELTV